jgi:hypothetical protein
MRSTTDKFAPPPFTLVTSRVPLEENTPQALAHKIDIFDLAVKA